MKKICPKCGKEFECVHSKDCWCAKVTITDEARLKLLVVVVPCLRHLTAHHRHRFLGLLVSCSPAQLI